MKAKTDENEWAGAICRQFDPDWWFLDDAPTQVITGLTLDSLELALRMCKECPLREQCAVLGMQPNDMAHGIWGGYLPGERMTMAGRVQYTWQRRHVTKAATVRRLTRVKMPEITPTILKAAKEAPEWMTEIV